MRVHKAASSMPARLLHSYWIGRRWKRQQRKYFRRFSSVFGAVRAESFLTAPDHSQFPGFVCESEACVKCAIGFLLWCCRLSRRTKSLKPWIFVPKHVFLGSSAQNQNCMPSARTERKKNNTKRQTKTALLCTSEQVHNRYTMQIFGNSLTSLGGRKPIRHECRCFRSL